MAQGYYNMEEASRRLGISPETLVTMIQRGEIRGFEDGDSYRFRVDDVEEFYRRGQMVSDPDILIPDTLGDPDEIFFVEEADDQVDLDDINLSGIGLDPNDADVTIVGLRGQAEAGASGVNIIVNEDPSLSGKINMPISSLGEKSSINLPDDLGSESGDDLVLEEDPFSDPGLEAPVEISAGPQDSDPKLSFQDSGLNLDEAEPAAKDDSLIHLFDEPAAGDPGRTSVGATGSKTKVGGGADELDFVFDDALVEELKKDDEFDLSTLDSSDGIPLSGVKKSGASSRQLEEFDSFDLASDDDIDLGGSDSDITKGGPASGINLADPSDSGISLEGDSDYDSEFDLTLDSAETETPGFRDDDEDDFALSMDSSEESVDSDFELEIADEEGDYEAESGSEVVAIDEDEEYEYEDDDEVEMMPRAERGGQVVMMAQEAPWPAWLVAPLALTTMIFALVGIMTLELLRSAWSYQQPYGLSGTVIEQVVDLGKSIGLGG